MTHSDEDLLFLDRGLAYLRSMENIRVGLTSIVRAAAAAIGSDSASLYLTKPSAATLQPYVLVNFPDAYLQGCSSVPLGTQCCGRAALHKVPWAVTDMWSDPMFADCADAARQAGMRAGLSVPVLMPDDECIGTLAAQFRHVYEPAHRDIVRLRQFARLISLAIMEDTRARRLDPGAWTDTELAAGPIAA